MRCPTCGFDNLLGSDICDNCGSDLAGHDTPQSATTFRGRLLGERLDRLKIAPPEIVDASADVDDAIRRMHDKGIDCVLVVEAGRLVGIFTDRDAVLKGRRDERGRQTDLGRHDPRSGRPPPRRDDRGRPQQDGGRWLSPHPDRRPRATDVRRPYRDWRKMMFAQQPDRTAGGTLRLRVNPIPCAAFGLLRRIRAGAFCARRVGLRLAAWPRGPCCPGGAGARSRPALSHPSHPC